MKKEYGFRDHTHCPGKDSPCGMEGKHRCCLCGSLQKESEWEEEFDAEFSPENHWQGDQWVTDKLKAFISKSIAKAVEAERERIDEEISELPYLRNDEGVKELEEGVSYIEVKKVIPIINPSKE